MVSSRFCLGSCDDVAFVSVGETTPLPPEGARESIAVDVELLVSELSD